MPRIGMITNPHSKLNKRNPNRPHLLGYILGEQGIFEITKSASHLEEVALKFFNSNIDILAINGGDGTVSLTISIFIRIYGTKPLPKIALLKGGTMNVTAVNLGIRGQPEKLLSILIQKSCQYDQITTQKLQSIHIGDHYGFMYADGTAADILNEFYLKKTGHLGALFLGVRLWCSSLFNGSFSRSLINSRKVRLSTESTNIEHSSLGVLVSTVKRLPLRMPIFHHASKDKDKSLHAISVTSKPSMLKWHLVLAIYVKKLGQTLSKNSFTCEKLTISTQKKFLYTIDGELYQSERDNVTIEKGPLIEFISL